MNEALYKQIEDRYGFALPEEYQRLEARGLFAQSNPGHASEFYEPGSYLWLNDMEWYSLQEIAEFEFQSYHLPGFVPFAFTAGGDYWCWQPASTDERGTPVICCFHDYELATIYAPNFQAAVYRQILEFCKGSDDDPDVDAVAFLRRWAIDLEPVFPPPWRNRLLELAAVPDASERASEFERTDLQYEIMDTEIRWMQPMS
jgi:hypothetical protein